MAALRVLWGGWRRGEPPEQTAPSFQAAKITTTGADPQGNVTYIHDAEGNIILRRDPTSTTLYLPDEQLVRDNTTGTVLGTRYYTHNGTLVGERVGRTDTILLITDPHGSAQTAIPTNTDGTGTPIRRYFDPYGNPIPASATNPVTGGTWPDDRTFLNKPTDTTTGLASRCDKQSRVDCVVRQGSARGSRPRLLRASVGRTRRAPRQAR